MMTVRPRERPAASRGAPQPLPGLAAYNAAVSQSIPAPEATDLATATLGRRHASLSKLAVDELRRSILTGRRKPGDRLVEDRLSEEMGVSRVPIREALRALAAEGLVEVQPRRGASVAGYSSEVARDLVEVRATLEGLNAKLAARHHAPEIVAELREVLARGNQAALAANVDDLVRLNGEFHDKLAIAGGNSILWDIMRTLRERTSLVFAANTARRAEQDWGEHSGILAAVIDGDEELASMLASRHVRRAADAAFALADDVAQAAAE
jgi:DNA-binding GntR family transcriptional regulator